MQLDNKAIIKIKNLRLRTYIGINEDEVNNKQDIIINAQIHYCAQDAVSTDDMNNAVNYRTITKKIITLVEQQRFSLLEKLTADVLGIVSEHASVSFAQVEVDKPYADSVSLTLSLAK